MFDNSQPLNKSLSAPVSARGLFGGSDSDDFDNESQQSTVSLAGFSFQLLERPFHPLNANAVWPGAHVLAEWLTEHRALVAPPLRCLELGAATGALALVATSSLGLDWTTSDVDDGEVAEAIAANFALNSLTPPPHVPHTWGTPWEGGRYDVVLASDILLYVAVYPALVATLEALCAPLDGAPGAVFYMSWQRRMKESEQFFTLLKARGFAMEHLGRLVYRIAWSQLPHQAPLD